MAGITASSDAYPYGQCTWWASHQYQVKTGVYPPNTWGDAHSWLANAVASGWKVSSTPPPSAAIVCLQPYVQGAGFLGHVAVVESVSNGSVTASNMNWGDTAAERASVQNVVFTFPANGLSFLTNGTATLAATTTGLDFSFLSTAWSQLSGLWDWIESPVRILKMITGLFLIGLSLLVVIAPPALQVAKKAIESGALA